MKHLRLLVLPLDDRPCGFEQVASLADIAGIEVVLPPRELITSLSNCHDFEAVCGFLHENLGRVDAAVISAEQFIYGGLIRSRKHQINATQAIDRVEQLGAMLARHPGVRSYVSSVLLRLSVTLDQNQGEQVWRDVFRYSVLSDPESRELAPAAREAELTRLARGLPAGVLEEYLEVRRRNHEVNLALLEMAPRPSYLLFGQEDCAPFGLHRAEKHRLENRLRDLQRVGSQTNSLILTGADELASMLVMRAYMDHRGVPAGRIPLQLLWSDPAGKTRISRYEDISVEENLRLHLEPSPFFSTESPSEDRVLIHLFPESGQEDLCFPGQRKEGRFERAQWLDQVRPGDSVLDLYYANGAHSGLLEALSERLKLTELSAFSAWNTTGNATGTWIAHVALKRLAREHGEWNEAADRRYLQERIADDWLYQARVRPGLLERAGPSSWALGDDWERMSSICEEKVREELASYLPEAQLRSASLPWPRVFEARILLDLPSS